MHFAVFSAEAALEAAVRTESLSPSSSLAPLSRMHGFYSKNASHYSDEVDTFMQEKHLKGKKSQKT